MKINVFQIAELFKAAAKAAEEAGAADPDDGGTCNMDQPAFRIPGGRHKELLSASAIARVDITKFRWFGGDTWYWLMVPLRGQGALRTRMMEAAQKVLNTFAEANSDWFKACGYMQAD